ncbi:MAG TPA: calcium-binding protein [Mycobacterium sp.]|nr:calcium-binding protein [Mycobacterium sp.]
MSVYQRSDVPFANNLFTLPLTPDYWTSVLTSNFPTLLGGVLGGVITNPNLNLPDGSILTLQGTFTVALGLGTADISGTVTGLVRTAAGMIIETVSGFSLPFTAHYDAFNSANNSSSAPTLPDIINGDDQLNGGSQDDLLMGFGGADTFNGGAGTDTVSYVAAPTAVRADLGNPATNTGSDAVGDTYSSIENLIGSQFNDTLVGNAQDNVLTGGLGTDSMLGGLGNDSYVVDNIGDVVTENLNQGSDTVHASIDYRLTANVEYLVLQGGAVQGYGNALSNAIYGTGADNLLDGDTGADAMYGGAGSDSYFLDNISDSISENANEGSDTVYASANYRLGANVEYLVLQGSAVQGYGNSLTNVISGTSADNLLDGDAGADAMYGGAGNDSYFLDNINDQVVENLNAGSDTVYSTANYRLGANVEYLVLQGGAVQGYGNSLTNVISGTSADNLLDGDAGADAMYGGAGNDSYFVDHINDAVVENLNEGSSDTVYASVDYRLGANVENLVLQGAAVQGYGNALANALSGTSNGNLLNGGGGGDFLTGGGGNDFFAFNTGEANGDIVADFAGGGTGAGDSLLFVGYGTTVQGATFTRIGMTNQWQIHSGLDGHNEIITFSNGAAIDPTDYSFM